MHTFKHLKEFLNKYKWRYILGVLVLLLVDGLQLITPRLIGIITDGLNSKSLSIQEIYKYIFYIILIACTVAFFRYVWRILIMGAARELEYWLRNKFFNHLETLSVSFFHNKKTGDLMAHATNDINAIRMAFGPGIVMITDAIFISVTTVIIMCISIDIRLTCVALFPLPLLALAVAFFGKLIQKRFKKVQEIFSDLTDKVQENISGIRVIKSFVQEKSQIDNFSRENEKYVNANMHLVKVWGMMFPFVTFMASLSFVIALSYGGMLVIDKEISLGQFVSFITYLGLLTWPMMAIGWVVNVLQRGVASMNRINEILDTKPEVFDDTNCLNINDFDETIEFKNLTFIYPNSKDPALSNINIKIKKGETLAIVGKTGSGKSTMVNLLLRLFNVEKESIFIGGYDIMKLPLSTLRKNIGYVMQDSFLFSATIKENIAFSDQSIAFDKIKEAAKYSNVFDDIMDFPNQFDTVVGERGITLSGGQKQRICISRALIKNPKILILDDCLSAVDTKTEEKILSSLKQIMKNRTSIIIAHRISTIKDADNIIVLDQGRIVEQGNHEELVKLGGIYSDMYEKQLLEEKIEREE